MKPDAVPSQFENCPAYLSKAVPEPRTGSASSSVRHENVYARAEEAAEAFLVDDEVSSLSHLKEKLDRSCLPSGTKFSEFSIFALLMNYITTR